MPRDFCGRSTHFRRLLPGDGSYSITYRVLRLFVEVRAAGAAPSHHISIIIAMEIIALKITSSINTKDQRERLPGLQPAFCLALSILTVPHVEYTITVLKSHVTISLHLVRTCHDISGP